MCDTLMEAKQSQRNLLPPSTSRKLPMGPSAHHVGQATTCSFALSYARGLWFLAIATPVPSPAISTRPGASHHYALLPSSQTLASHSGPLISRRFHIDEARRRPTAFIADLREKPGLWHGVLKEITGAHSSGCECPAPMSVSCRAEEYKPSIQLLGGPHCFVSIPSHSLRLSDTL